MKKHWTQDELQQLSNTYNVLPMEELILLFGRSKDSIVKKASELTLERRGGKFKRKHRIELLLQDSLEAFYWIGFVMADGCFSNSTLTLSLSEKDQPHLNKFASFIKVDSNKIRKTKRSIALNGNEAKSYEIATLEVGDKSNIPLLMEKFNFKKSKTYNPPDFMVYNFTDDQLIAMFIGFIDGDGSINYTNGSLERFIIKCHSSWLPNLKFFHELLLRKYPLSKGRPPKINPYGMAQLIGNNNHVKYMKEFIKDHKLPALDRKWFKD